MLGGRCLHFALHPNSNTPIRDNELGREMFCFYRFTGVWVTSGRADTHLKTRGTVNIPQPAAEPQRLLANASVCMALCACDAGVSSLSPLPVVSGKGKIRSQFSRTPA